MGGVAGHMAHLHESMDLTFGEIKSILLDVAASRIDTFEKVDGQNIFFAWDRSSGRARCARNMGDIERGGMTPREYASKWRGHPAEAAFMGGFAAIEGFLGTLPRRTLEAVFETQGRKYVNAEIVCARSPNMIRYDENHIVIHNLQDFSGERAVVLPGRTLSELTRRLDGSKVVVDGTQWTAHGPMRVQIPDTSRGAHCEKLISDIDEIRGALPDSATLADWVAQLLRKGPVGDLRLSPCRSKLLIERIVGLVSGAAAKHLPDLRTLKSGLTESAARSVSDMATVTTVRSAVSALTEPLEWAISEFALEALRGVSSALVHDHESEMQRQRAELQESIRLIRAARGAAAIPVRALLEKQLSKLGSVENLNQTIEGIVFEHPKGNGRLCKLTGSFAMVNQIVGRARRMPAD